MFNGTDIAKRALHRAEELKAERGRFKKRCNAAIILGAFMLIAAMFLVAFNLTGVRNENVDYLTYSHESFEFYIPPIPLSGLTGGEIIPGE